VRSWCFREDLFKGANANGKYDAAICRNTDGVYQIQDGGQGTQNVALMYSGRKTC